jgi:peptidoglycan-associated lipoprotein
MEYIMVKNIGLAFCALVLVSGCSKKSMDSGFDAALNAKFAKEAGSDRVFFGFDKSDVTHEGMSVLHKQAEWLKSHSSIKATIEGHCDERGTREYNLALGERRADAVKKVLMHDGINCDRIETISYGKERPAVVGADKEASAQNRRGVTMVRN